MQLLHERDWYRNEKNKDGNNNYISYTIASRINLIIHFIWTSIPELIQYNLSCNWCKRSI